MFLIETPIEKVAIERHFRRHVGHFPVHEARQTLYSRCMDALHITASQDDTEWKYYGYVARGVTSGESTLLCICTFQQRGYADL